MGEQKMSEDAIYPLSNSAREGFSEALRLFGMKIDEFRADDDRDPSIANLLIGVKSAISEMSDLMKPGAGTVTVGGKKISADERIGELYEWADRRFSDIANAHVGEDKHPVHKWYAIFSSLGPTMNRALPSVSEAFEASWRAGNGRPPMPIGPARGRQLVLGS